MSTNSDTVLAMLNDLAGVTAADEAGSHDIFTRWRLPADDRNSRKTADDLADTWDGWSDQEKDALLLTIDAIVVAERWKDTEKSDVHKQRLHNMSRNAAAAARLALDIAETYPPPWDAPETRAIGDLVHHLFAFSLAGVTVTARTRLLRSANDAQLLLKRLRAIPQGDGRRPPTWDLIRDLVWLASGKRYHPDDRTIRRYLTDPPSRSSVQTYWKQNWKVITALATTIGADVRSHDAAIEHAMTAYLDMWPYDGS